MKRPSQQARDLLADAVLKGGPAWAGSADSIRAGNWGNVWTEAALVAIDRALMTEPETDDGE